MNSQNNDLNKILLSALNQDYNIRNYAEKQIEILLKNNFSDFLLELSKKLADEKEEKTIRQLSATIIKNKIKEFEESWHNLDKNMKEQIKNNILSTLITPIIDVKKAAGLSIAGICIVELPKNQWLNIFDILINALQNDNLDVKITSLITLRYIYEELQSNSIYINNNTIAKLTNMYYSILTAKNDNNVNLIKECLISLKSFVPFLEGIISNDNSRLVFLNLIKEYMLNNNEEIRAQSIDIFICLINYYYKYFQVYMDILIPIIFQILEKDSEINKKYCYEFLCAIAEHETNINNSPININYYFLDKYKEQLSKITLNDIITNNFDEEGYTISKYSSILISYMCQCCDFKFTEIMLNYYNNNISSNNPVIKFSALNIFESILCTNEKLKLFPIVKQSLPLLSTILLEGQTLLSVRKLIAKIMKLIIKYFGLLIIKENDLFDKFMTLFLTLLKDPQPEIVFKTLEAIHTLVKNIETNEYLETNLLTQYTKNYYEILLNLSQNINLFNNDHNIPMVALYTLGDFGQHLANDARNMSINIFKSLVEMFLKTLNKDVFKDDKIRLNYQEYLCTSLDSILSNKKVLDKDVRNLFNYVIQSFQQRQEIYEEGITVIGAIASFLQRSFIIEMNNFNSYLLHGLTLTNSFDICKSCLLCLNEIIMSTGPDFNIYVGEYLKIVLNILSDNQMSRELKPYCFFIMSSLFLSCKQEIFKYFNEIMTMVGGAFEACLMDYNNQKENIDFINYIMQLKENVLETMGCIFNAVQDLEKTDAFVPYAKSTVIFINKILRDETQLNIDIIRNALAIIADFCRVYGTNIKPILNITLLKNIIEKSKNDKEKMKDKEFQDFILWAQKIISDVVIKN